MAVSYFNDDGWLRKNRLILNNKTGDRPYLTARCFSGYDRKVQEHELRAPYQCEHYLT
jgi:hypothetical protein